MTIGLRAVPFALVSKPQHGHEEDQRKRPDPFPPFWQAKTFFWVLDGRTRWHLTSQPLTVTEGRWAGEPNRVVLKNDPSLWHMSWTGRPNGPAPLDEVLGHTTSYGFAFVGFVLGITGRLCMVGFEIRRD